MNLNLVQKYLLYTKKHEAPEAFHAWTIMTLIGAASGRRVYMNRGFYQIFPGQMMVIFVAGSAIVRKSTAVRIGVNILRESGVVEIISGKASPEAFLDSMQLGTDVDPVTKKIRPRDSHVLICAPELSSFLSKQAYTEALLPILTDLSDAPKSWIFRTRGKGEVALHNVCLGFLGASTPDWLAEAIPPNAFGGGFMSRIIWVYQESTTRRNPMPEKEDFERALEQDIINELKKIASYQGEAKLTPEARTWFVNWYEDYMSTPLSQQDGYYGRRADHLLRVALIIAIGHQSPFTIDTHDLESGYELLLAIEKEMPNAFAQIGTSAIAREQNTILRILARNGGNMSLQELARATWRRIDFSELTLALQTLKAAGFVREVPHGAEVFYQLLQQPDTSGGPGQP